MLLCLSKSHVKEGPERNADPKENPTGMEWYGNRAAGSAMFVLGKWIYPNDQDAVIHADIRLLNAAGEPGVDEDTIFEDTGYGARRLK